MENVWNDHKHYDWQLCEQQIDFAKNILNLREWLRSNIKISRILARLNMFGSAALKTSFSENYLPCPNRDNEFKRSWNKQLSAIP